MTYQWVSHGDNDACLCKRCYLGPYVLEVKENGWTTSDQPTFLFTVFTWNDKAKRYSPFFKDKTVTITQDKAKAHAEDWYGENIIFEELALGTKS